MSTSMHGHGVAGRSGDGVRSDARAEVTLRDHGGISFELKSKVAPYFGESIEQQARATLEALGVDNAELTLVDAGALPFVLEARVEAAVRATGAPLGGDARPEGPGGPGEPTTRQRLRRSRLYVPGNEPKFMVNAGLYGCDGIILDLEDSVHPDAKEAARLLVRNALRCVDFRGAERMVRINQLPLGIADLAAVVPEKPDLILIPKVETAEQVEEVAVEIQRLQEHAGEVRDLWLMPILESALGIENAFGIAAASERVVALTIGLEDYTADLGVVKTRDGAESAWARQRLVNAARAAGLQAIDSVYGDFGDLDGLRAWGARSRGMGYEGMGCIHPSQIRVIHEAFAPAEKELAKALKIVSAFREAEAEGRAVVNLGSKMIDPPVVERARRLVAQAAAMGLIDEETPE